MIFCYNPFISLQPVIRLYDIPDNTFETEDDDDEDEAEDELNGILFSF